MKFIFRKMIKPLLLLLLVLFLASCNFSNDAPVFTPLPVVPDLPVTLTANFNIDKSTPQPLMDILTQTNTAATNADRSATASMPGNTQIYVQAVTVNEAVPLTVNVPDDDIDTTNSRFTINLLTGHKWGITVGIKDTDINETILYDYYEKELTSVNTDMSHDFSLKPHITSGVNGSIHLEINLADTSYSVSIQDQDNAYSDWNTNLSTTGATRTLDITSIPSGIYVLKITFSKTNSIPFTATQTVTVYDYLKTNKWVSGGNAFIDSSGNFLLSSQIIAAANSGKKIYYVDGNTGGAGSDTNPGNFNAPLQTMARAIALINAVGNTTDTYKIYVKGGTTENLASNQITIGELSSTRKMEILTYQSSPTDGLGAVTLTHTAPISLVVVRMGSSLTISGNFTFDGNNTSCSGIINSGTLTMNKGIVQKCSDGGVSNDGLFNFNGGSIINNGSYGINFGSIAQLNIQGNLNVYNNNNGTTPRNVYLTSGKTINVVGQISDTSKICVTTDVAPDLTTSQQITTNYSTHNSAAAGTVFKGDIYGIKQVSGEAYLAASGGALTERYSDDVQITIEGPNTVWQGTGATATVTVTKNGTVISPTLTLQSFNSTGSSYNSDTYRTFEENTITLPNSLVQGRYTATVTTTIEGVKYSGAKTFNVVPKEIEVSSGNFNTGATIGNSVVFKAGRSTVANIKPLIAGTHEVTQKEYEMYCTYGSTAANDDDNYEYPAYYVSWYDAIIYCNLRTLNDSTFGNSRSQRLSHCAYALGGVKDPVSWDGIQVSDGKYYGPNSDNPTWNGITFNQNADGWRLPTEAEWEYLARSGVLTTTGQTDYSGSNTIDDVAWYGTNSGLWNHEVCTKAPNGLGLYDMSGNVFEWVWDWYTADGNITTTTEYAGPESGSNRVGRSGGWDNDIEWCKVHARTQKESSFRDCQFGFRVVRNAQ